MAKTTSSASQIWHVDRPAYRPAAPAFELQGWVAGEAACTLEPVAGHFEQFEWIDRADLVPPPAGRRWARGFRARYIAVGRQGGSLVCRARSIEGTSVLTWQFPESVDPAAKSVKLRRIARELVQPGLEPVVTADYLDFLPAEIARAEPLQASGYRYPPRVEELVRDCANGWILDCGAGHRPDYLANVVNLEVVPYPSTDVLADAEKLPFQDGVFDGIVTLAVMEHVRRPWIVAGELIRVLKPGGLLIADVPFLQPVHDYPDHYFNMTSNGLRSLFSDRCEIITTEVPRYGAPVHTLAWFLQRYAAGLPSDVRERFRQLRVADLDRPVADQLGLDYVTHLHAGTEFELASVTTLVARRR